MKSARMIPAALVLGCAAVLLVWRPLSSSPQPALAGGGTSAAASAENARAQGAPEEAGGARARSERPSPVEVRLSGRVVDRHGTPRVGERIWLLGSDDTHPANLGTARRLTDAVSDADGGFELTAISGAPWVLSVGRIGAPLLTSEPTFFEAGSSPQVEIVLGGSAHLVVSLAEEDDAGALVEVMRRSQPGDSVPFGAPAPTRLLERGGAPTQPDPWQALAAQRLDPGQAITFTSLPVGDELRLAFVRDSGRRVESESTFTLVGDERTRASCAVEVGEPLRVSLVSSPCSAAPPASFYWK